MKAVVETVLNSPVPQITLKPETLADEAILDAILNRNGAASAPDCGYAIISFEHNGTSFQKLTFGLTNISNAMQSSKYLIAGGSVWSGTGLTYDVTAINYYFNGNKTADATQITLSASDPTNDRVDAIVVDESGVISIIEGVAASPALVPPIPLDQLLIQYVVVKATTTEPVIVEEAVYLDNDEWTTSTFNLPGTAIIGSTDFEATGVPKHGTKFISNVGRNQNTVLRFAHAGALNINDFTTASFWVRLPQTLPNGCNIVAGLSMDGLQYSGIVPLSLFGLKNNITNAWQLVVIPMSISTLTVFNQLVIGVIGNTSGINYDIDEIKLSNGSISVINAPEMSIYKNGAYVGKKSNLNFVEDDGVELDVTENALQNRIDVKIKAEGGGGGGTWGSITGILSNQTDLQTALNGKVDENAAITGATKTKITYDSKGLVTSGADATTADIADSTNKRYVTDANLVVIGNTSGTNTGDNATNSQYSGLAASKQDTLVSGTNIKTINSNSLLGSGDLVITAGDGNDDFMLVASFKSLYNY